MSIRKSIFWSREFQILPFLVCLTLGITSILHGQSFNQTRIAFVSDTQAPMKIETILLKQNQNVKATGLIFHDILSQKPNSLFILGDVVSLGYKNKKWNKMDRYLDSCRKAGIHVSAVLGNHDVMTRAKKGEHRFQTRFPDHVRLGFYQITDSVAIVSLNSNFSKLSRADIEKQQNWLRTTLHNLDEDKAVLATIVTCHHAPYSNSKIVGSSAQVQKNFVPEYFESRKACLFITGHSHNYEHFLILGKDFLVIGGGGGLHQPLSTQRTDISGNYKPAFHYVLLQRNDHNLIISSRYLKENFDGFENGISFTIKVP